MLSEDEYDFRFDIGISQPVQKYQLSKKSEIVSCMSKHFAILQVKAELDQILCGLSETLNALELIRKNSMLFKPLFVHFDRPALTADQLFDMLLPKYSPNGSNLREKEEAVTMFWLDFLNQIQSK